MVSPRHKIIGLLSLSLLVPPLAGVTSPVAAQTLYLTENQAADSSSVANTPRFDRIG
jgi:hypothetical protein